MKKMFWTLFAVAVITTSCGGETAEGSDSCTRELGSGERFDLGPCQNYDDVMLCPGLAPPPARECDPFPTEGGEGNLAYFCCRPER